MTEKKRNGIEIAVKITIHIKIYTHRYFLVVAVMIAQYIYVQQTGGDIGKNVFPNSVLLLWENS